MRRVLLPLTLVGAMAGALLCPRPAQAWDPSTTSQALLDAAVRRASLHLRWMESSAMQFGLFSNLRVDPARLDPQTRAWLQAAVEHSHGDIGAKPRGGPGACPGSDAPTELLQNCVSGDLWELDAIGWMRLGMVAQGVPRERRLRHFLDLQDPTRKSWRDASGARSRAKGRRFSRAANQPVARRISGASYDGQTPSAIAFFEDTSDPLGPHAVAAHQRMAVLSPDPQAREHHRALALLATGATLRVVMDTGLPAYARGDSAAFAASLSDKSGDRGEPMTEFVRARYGRDLPIESPAPGSRPTVDPSAGSLAAGSLAALVANASGDAGPVGLGRFSARHFVSAGTLPKPAFVEAKGGGKAALVSWLGDDDLGLDPTELTGAKLSPWPAPRGYVVNAAGRPLFAFTRDEDGYTQAFVDETIFADAFAHLAPRIVETAAAALELMHADVPPPQAVGAGLIWQFEIGADQRDAKLWVFFEDDAGQRTLAAKVALRSGQSNRLVGVPQAPSGQRVVFVVDYVGADGLAKAAEHTAPPT